MAEFSSLNLHEQIALNENTPPETIKPYEHELLKRRNYTPNNANESVNFGYQFKKMNLNDVISPDNLNNKSKDSETIEKSAISGIDSFDRDKSLSSNGYTYDLNSSKNDSSILNSSVSEVPDTSTPQQSILSQSYKYKMHRPPDLVIHEPFDKDNYKELIDLEQCSPVLSPFPIDDSFNDSLFSHDATPEPDEIQSPPKGSFLKEQDRKMVHLLKRYGLSHFAFIFIEQEVDIGLFLTLNDQDLKEIGIKRNTDRNVILSVISECNNRR